MENYADEKMLDFIIKEIVDYPGDIKISRTIDEMGVLLTLSINKADMGRVIGKEGNTAKAIRTILRTIGMKNGSRVNFKINEPEGSQDYSNHSDGLDDLKDL